MTNILRVVKTRPIIPVINIISTSKFATTDTAKTIQPNTINMSFASYESTQTPSGDMPSPLVIMHGLFGSKANWNSLCKAFHQKTSPQRKIISVDARNHGDSPHSNSHTYLDLAGDVKTLLHQLHIKKAAVLGHSMGGRAMMYFALRHPNLVDKLIVADISPISTSPNFKSVIKIFNAMQKVLMPKNVPMSSARISADLQLSRSINDKGLRAFILTNMVQKSDGSYAWRINIPVLLSNFNEHILSFPKIDGLQFEGPVLFVGGGKSDFIQKTDHSHILRMFPKAEFKIIDGAGHWLHSEKPSEFLKLCTDFLNKKVAAIEKTTISAKQN
ncbi:hypothetical protein ILUMI_11882 [Ignelater luminosus]|uniref:sn-1-specific diacylglycerol lipase ABHD11 n=1 Tax=Ignelater luminosus TaxID=2038154 RepID=A0A8K0CVA2_IGNLU|nr:hypothetical protein ILUMI_11882 [Ignelater luminosus]